MPMLSHMNHACSVQSTFLLECAFKFKLPDVRLLGASGDCRISNGVSIKLTESRYCVSWAPHVLQFYGGVR